LYAVEFKNITKKFGNFTANENISFTVKKNSVHCILGENGAGKTTLMKILFGIYKQDSGSIKLFDEEVKFKSPHDAIDKKIGMVHQHFMLIEDFTVLENIILGNEITKGIQIDFVKSKQILNELISKYNLGLNPDNKISEISISEQQKVEILKLLYRNSEILIFDEPTAVLSPVEVADFFKIINTFKADGKTIIFITHKLNEVKEIADRVSVLRKGKLVFETDNTENNLDLNILSNAIIGESAVSNIMHKKTFHDKNETVLSLKNVNFKKNKINLLEDLNLELSKGEIHGICGVEGNGQNEIVDIAIGLEKKFEGEYKHSNKSISLVPDDRLKKGMIKEFSIGENIILKNCESNFISNKLLQKLSADVIERYDVRVSNVKSDLGSLSGGNQQKVIFAREIEAGNEIMIFSHPTRGVDIKATQFIHSKIIEQRNNNKAILLISSDLDELLTLSDKLSVIYNGNILKTFDSSELQSYNKDVVLNLKDTVQTNSLHEAIGKLMIGIIQ